MNEAYVDTVRLLLDVTAPIFSSGRFAMKGGTALNLFVQDMPRLSVDIDLVLTDSVLDRDGALEIISTDLAAIRTALKQMGHHANLPPNEQGDEVKLQVSNGTALVKVEVNVVFRGTVLPVEQRRSCPSLKSSPD